jgi:uroporphyrinogen-III decarboxylase
MHPMADVMTPKQRMAHAMRREKTDRVPVMCQMSIGHMLLQTGFSPMEFWLSVEAFAEGLLRMREVYGFDGILISLHGHSSDWPRRARKIERLGEEEVVWWKNGSRTVFPQDDLPRHYSVRHKPVLDPSEVDPSLLPETLDYIPVSQGLDFPVDPDHSYDIFDHVIAGAGHRVSIHGEVASPFDYFLHLFGFSNALVNLLEAPQVCEEVLRRLAEGVKRIALGQVEKGIDALKISSPYAGSGFISPQLYRRFVLPFESRIVDAVKSQGVPVYLHTCGAISDRLEMMIESGISGLECLDPPPLGDVSLKDAKARIGGKVFIKGNIDPVHVLLNGALSDIEADAVRRINIGMPGGGYILSSACSIAPHTPRENIQVLLQLAEERGRY